MRRHLAVAVVGLMVTLAACSGGPDPGTSPTPTGPTPTSSAPTSPAPTASPAPTSPAPTATPAPTSPGPTSPPATQSATPTQASPASCTPFGSTAESTSRDPLALSLLTGDTMRVGRHDCYERFVFEMAGRGKDPGWRVAYRSPLTGQGSGEPIPLKGTADLEILIGAMTVTDFDGRPDEWPPFSGPGDIITSGFVALLEAKMLYGFEGTTQIGLGLDRERPFRAWLIDNPPRLVVDVYTGQLLR